ncbi:hypothetical protein MSAN_01201700 [Mycena sanguinolenta]|uniref:Uncharacterized protein n=1 Tax=Mycena sanguinolenta TaxID=230812 RepID=A0A8H7D224_9AGAR|nr:hypothetical protein MSAN_01201700 [Mycena sanguinolenta]
MTDMLQTLLLHSFHQPIIHIVISPLLSSRNDLKTTMRRPANYADGLVINMGTMHGGTGGTGGTGPNSGNGGVGEGPSVVQHADNVAVILDPQLLKPGGTLLDSIVLLIPKARLLAGPSLNEDVDVRDLPNARSPLLTIIDYDFTDVGGQKVSKAAGAHAAGFQS